jgi:hypothetical protein
MRSRDTCGDTNRLIYSLAAVPTAVRRCVKTFTIHRFTAAATNDSGGPCADNRADTGGACTRVRGANAIKSAVVRLLCRAAYYNWQTRNLSRADAWQGSPSPARRSPSLSRAVPLCRSASGFKDRLTDAFKHH